jgi:DNA modification methylase
MSDRWTLHVGNCLDVMRDMEENSVDSIVTDPPYGLAFMGKRWDYDVPSVEIWAECLRVLKPGGHLLAFAGTRTQHRMAVRIEDGGFEIRDMIAWVYGSGFPKSHNGPWGGTALKPALEPITMARKPLEGTVAANVQEWGTGGLNIDGCRVPGAKHTQSTSHPGGQHGTFRPLAARGAQLDDGTGRWPANLIHDGSDEVVGLLDDAARFFYCAKASKSDRGDDNNHPTVKPTDLMRYLCRLITPPGGLVFDPFTGSGSTGKAAMLEGFRFVGAELSEEYAEIARARIGHAASRERQKELALS